MTKHPPRPLLARAALWLALLVLSACTSTGRAPEPAGRIPGLPAQARSDVVLHAMSLIDVGYVFGGRNPEAGVDCSGLVRLVYENATGLRLPHNAARQAELARAVERKRLAPGDLVFFNTLGTPFSHVGLYLGDDRFIHAPRSNSAVRIDSLRNPYFAARFEGGRSFFED